MRAAGAGGFCGGGVFVGLPLFNDTFPSGINDNFEMRGHAQVTDVYLLGLAVAHGGTLATFDRSIPLGAVSGARPSHLTVIGPA